MRRPPSIACLAVLLALLPHPQPLRAQGLPLPAQGLSDPTLAFGPSGVTAASPAMPFLDLMKSMRPFIATGAGDDKMSHKDLVAGGWLDARGWPRAIPPGMSGLRTIWDWSASKANPGLAQSRAGTYVLTHRGQGKIKLSGDVRVISAEPGRIVFDNRAGGTMTLQILQTGPGDDYLRDITLVRAEYETLHALGQIFNPQWLALMQDARQLRFMDWMETNGSPVVDWADRALSEDASWSGEAGVPVEVMVDLSNQTGAEPWFTMPVGASDDFIRQFATHVRDRLNPGLKVHVEFGNETWNNALPSYHALARASKADWGVSAPMDYYAKRATQTAVIWEEVFGAAADARIDNVLGAQTMNISVATRALRAPQWQEFDPEGYVEPASVIDSLAVTTYFGGSHMKNADLRAELLAQIAAGGAVTDWFKARLMDPQVQGSIPQIAAAWDKHRALADEYGLDLTAYEGGQHLLHAFNIKGIAPEDMETLVDFMARFIRSPDMADLYLDLWKAWTKVSDGPFMQFGDVSAVSKFGAWGVYASLNDTNPRAELLSDLNARTPNWFSTDGGGPQFQQGVIRLTGAGSGSGSGGETLTGTDLDDYLVGGPGDDTIIPGRGRDAIAGEAGSDTLVLPGLPAEYTLTPEGPGHRLTGAGSSLLLRGIETVRFADGQEIALDAMPAN